MHKYLTLYSVGNLPIPFQSKGGTRGFDEKQIAASAILLTRSMIQQTKCCTPNNVAHSTSKLYQSDIIFQLDEKSTSIHLPFIKKKHIPFYALFLSKFYHFRLQNNTFGDCRAGVFFNLAMKIISIFPF